MNQAARTILLVLLAATLGRRAVAEGEAHALAFDGVNVPLADVLAQAKAEKRLVFLDFYLPG